MLRFDINLVFTIINVLILFAVVRIFLWKPVKNILAKRAEEVEGEYGKAEEAKSDAEKSKADYEQKLKDIDDEKASIIAESRAQATEDYERVIDNAHEKADEIIAEAKQKALEEKEKSLIESKREVADIVAEAAAKLVTASDSAENDSALYDEFLKKAEQMNS